MNQEPLNPTGWLRGLNLTIHGTTNAGAFEALFTDPRYPRSWLRRCRVSGCQRRREHAGQHYRRRRWPRRGFSCWGGDEPFSIIRKRDESVA